MPADDFDSLAARADLSRLLAACYYQPGPEFAEEGLFDSLHGAAARLDGELAARSRRLGDAFGAADPQELLVDYTRLFLGPIEAPARPYGSVWLEARQGLMQDSTVAVLDLYAEGGFEMDESFRDLPDHVAAELEFLYLLLFRQAEALRDGDAQAQSRFAALRLRLLDEQLGRWVDPFAAATAASAQTAFYRELAGLTEAFVDAEKAAAAGP
ncbi:MAG: molecular chaperone TorD family protein [Burkholderiales bacterium]|jgi:TorA maturation chaperone TorD|nr:molecular chaperone TorD family protein [Burkholderiales bacterium]